MIAEFQKRYDTTEGLRAFRAPGRVNVIGEHTDYNLGFVMPMALELSTFVGTAPDGDGKLRIYSEHHREMREIETAKIAEAPKMGHWSDYPVGVAKELVKLGFAIEPANVYIRSTVPEGSGLSSSAALEVSSALAFLRGREIDPLELARLCQRAEVQFVGMPCGIMDQYVSVFGRPHAAVAIDCRSLDRRYVEFPPSVSFVAVNTMVKHSLGSSAYRERVAECADAVEKIQHRFPSVKSLRDVTVEQFEAVINLLPPVVCRRARHVVTEDDRVNHFVDASASGGLEEMGALMVASHRSLQHDYEVSCEELDYLVDRAIEIDGVYGSRMTGGGFGGCTVTMLRNDGVAGFKAEIARLYRTAYKVEPRIYDCVPSAGAGEVADLNSIAF
jgi:galactokinase